MMSLLLYLLMIGVGLTLIIKSCKKRPNYPACGACGYDLSGTIGNASRCPECGGSFADVGIDPPQKRGPRVQLVAGIVLLVLPLTCAGGSYMSLMMTRSSARQAMLAQQQALQAQQAQLAAQQKAQKALMLQGSANTIMFNLLRDARKQDSQIAQLPPGIPDDLADVLLPMLQERLDRILQSPNPPPNVVASLEAAIKEVNAMEQEPGV